MGVKDELYHVGPLATPGSIADKPEVSPGYLECRTGLLNICPASRVFYNPLIKDRRDIFRFLFFGVLGESLNEPIVALWFGLLLGLESCRKPIREYGYGTAVTMARLRSRPGTFGVGRRVTTTSVSFLTISLTLGRFPGIVIAHELFRRSYFTVPTLFSSLTAVYR